MKSWSIRPALPPDSARDLASRSTSRPTSIFRSPFRVPPKPWPSLPTRPSSVPPALKSAPTSTPGASPTCRFPPIAISSTSPASIPSVAPVSSGNSGFVRSGNNGTESANLDYSVNGWWTCSYSYLWSLGSGELDVSPQRWCWLNNADTSRKCMHTNQFLAEFGRTAGSVMVQHLISAPRLRPFLNTDLRPLQHERAPDSGRRRPGLFTAATVQNPIGNAGRNILRANGVNRLDLGLLKMCTSAKATSSRSTPTSSTPPTPAIGVFRKAVSSPPHSSMRASEKSLPRRVQVGLRYSF